MLFLSFLLSENFTIKARSPEKSLVSRSQQVLLRKLFGLLLFVWFCVVFFFFNSLDPFE